MANNYYVLLKEDITTTNSYRDVVMEPGDATISGNGFYNILTLDDIFFSDYKIYRNFISHIRQVLFDAEHTNVTCKPQILEEVKKIYGTGIYENLSLSRLMCPTLVIDNGAQLFFSSLRVGPRMSLFDFDTYDILRIDVIGNSRLIQIACRNNQIDFLSEMLGKCRERQIVIRIDSETMSHCCSFDMIDVIEWIIQNEIEFEYTENAISYLTDDKLKILKLFKENGLPVKYSDDVLDWQDVEPYFDFFIELYKDHGLKFPFTSKTLCKILCDPQKNNLLEKFLNSSNLIDPEGFDYVVPQIFYSKTFDDLIYIVHINEKYKLGINLETDFTNLYFKGINADQFDLLVENGFKINYNHIHPTTLFKSDRDLLYHFIEYYVKINGEFVIDCNTNFCSSVCHEGMNGFIPQETLVDRIDFFMKHDNVKLTNCHQLIFAASSCGFFVILNYFLEKYLETGFAFECPGIIIIPCSTINPIDIPLWWINANRLYQIPLKYTSELFYDLIVTQQDCHPEKIQQDLDVLEQNAINIVIDSDTIKKICKTEKSVAYLDILFKKCIRHDINFPLENDHVISNCYFDVMIWWHQICIDYDYEFMYTSDAVSSVIRQGDKRMMQWFIDEWSSAELPVKMPDVISLNELEKLQCQHVVAVLRESGYEIRIE